MGHQGKKQHQCSGKCPVPWVMVSNPTVSGVISGKLILVAGIIQSTLWRGLAQCFDLDSSGKYQGLQYAINMPRMMILSNKAGRVKQGKGRGHFLL